MRKEATVLILDSDLDMRRRVSQMVEAYGYTPLEASSCAEATALVETEDVAVLVTDLSLPDGGGLGFISELQAKPKTRNIHAIVLSEASDKFIIAASIKAGAKAFIIKTQLSKHNLPPKIASLLNPKASRAPPATEGAEMDGLPSEPLVSPAALERMYRKARGSKALGFVVHRVTSLARSRSTSAKELATVIENDPGLAVRVLKVANSAFYGGGREIRTIEMAIVKLGLQEIARVAMSASVLDLLKSSEKEDEAFDRVALWEHCLAVAILARSLAMETGLLPEEEAYVGGLIHDISRLALAESFPQEMLTAIRLAEHLGLPILEVEQSIFGIDHQKVGQNLGEAWHLSESLTQMLGSHHMDLGQLAANQNPESHLAVVVRLANLLSKISGPTGCGDDFLEEIDFDACENLGISRETVVRVLASSQKEFKRSLQALSVSISVDEADVVLDHMANNAKVPGHRQACIIGDARPVATVKLLLDQLGFSITSHDFCDATCRKPEATHLFVILPKDAEDLPAFLTCKKKSMDCNLMRYPKTRPAVLILANKKPSEEAAPTHSPLLKVLGKPWTASEIRETVIELLDAREQAIAV